MLVKFAIITLVLSLFFTGFSSLAYGHGLGSVESELEYINGQYLKIKIKSDPDVLHGNEKEIDFKISTIDDDTDNLISDIEYKIDIINPNDNSLLTSFSAYVPDEQLIMKIIPSLEFEFSGLKTENDLWIGTTENPLIINGPLFHQGGLIQVNTTLEKIGSESITKNNTFETLLTIGEYIPFSIDYENTKYDLMFATYFDRIDDFTLDEENKKLTALMPFNWNKDFVEKIPFVHAEYYIPKTLNIFHNHEILMSVNGIKTLGTIDRSGEDEIVVHFLIPSPKLLKLVDEIPADTSDRIVFGIESGSPREVENKDAILEEGEKAIVLSSEEDWKFHLMLSPKGKINPNSEVSLHIEFHDPVTNTLIPQNTYNLDIFLNGEIIESFSDRYTPDGKDVIKTTFDSTGAVIVRIYNVNNFDTTGEFAFKVSEAPSIIEQQPSVTPIPDWIKNNAKWWSEDQIDDQTFVNGIQFLIKEKIISVPEVESSSTENESQIPDWLKTNAAWWADGVLSDSEFLTGVEWMITNGIIKV